MRRGKTGHGPAGMYVHERIVEQAHEVSTMGYLASFDLFIYVLFIWVPFTAQLLKEWSLVYFTIIIFIYIEN